MHYNFIFFFYKFYIIILSKCVTIKEAGAKCNVWYQSKACSFLPFSNKTGIYSDIPSISIIKTHFFSTFYIWKARCLKFSSKAASFEIVSFLIKILGNANIFNNYISLWWSTPALLFFYSIFILFISFLLFSVNAKNVNLQLKK